MRPKAKAAPAAVNSISIRVSFEVLGAIEKEARYYRETPDSVLRRKFGIPPRTRKLNDTRKEAK